MKRLMKLGMAVALTAALPALAAEYTVVGLGFEGMQVTDDLGIYTAAQVWNFYNGGYSRSADGLNDLVLGPDNYAVPFTSSALALMSTAAGGDGNFGPRYLDKQGGETLQDVGISALYFDADSPVLNYSEGFNIGFSFYYASTAPITVTLYDGLDASGSVVGTDTFLATDTCTLEDNTYCVWSLGSVSLSGTARSVRLAGLQQQALFDNVTFGSLTPIDYAIPVPEPSSLALVALGLAGVGWAARRRRSAA